MKRKTPPYLSYTTFRNFLESLRATAVPTRIDRGIIANMSGSNQALLLSTIKYLGLASEHGIPTADLKRLIESKEPKRQEIWCQILKSGYANLLDSKLDLERTTTDELAEAFRRQGVTSPDRIRKCVTFFSLAAKDAGLKLSPHVKPYAGKRRQRVDMERRAVVSRTLVKSKDAGGGSVILEELLAKFPNFDPSWSEEERNNWLSAFEKLSKIPYPSLNGSSGSID
jgi:hypothetical protein